MGFSNKDVLLKEYLLKDIGNLIKACIRLFEELINAASTQHFH